jgi:hypothetical protein
MDVGCPRFLLHVLAIVAERQVYPYSIDGLADSASALHDWLSFTPSKTFLTCFASINNSYDSETWDQMTAIKSRIFRIWDTAPPGIRMCCIKFAQRVVLCQTNGIDSDIRVGVFIP